MTNSWEELYSETVLPEAASLNYLTLGLASEVGEVATEVKKVIRNDNGLVTVERRLRIISEIGDVLWYAHGILTELNATDYDALVVTSLKLHMRQRDKTLRER